MAGIFRSICLIGAGLALILGAGVMAATTDREGRGPVVALAGLEAPYLKLLSVDVAASEVSLVWLGNGTQYRVSLGDDLNHPLQSVLTSQPRAVLAAPRAANPHGKVNYRVEVVDEGVTELALDGTLTLLPDVPRKIKVKRTAPQGAVVRWKPAKYATTYDVAISRSKRKLPANVRRLTKAGTAFATDRLKPESTYWMRVRSVGEAGVSEFGPPTKIETPPAEAQFTIGAWNICSEACSGFGGRVGGQAAQVHGSEVDIMTLQEAGGKRVGGTTRAAFSGGPRQLVMADGGGNSRYIFYASDTFTQLGGGRWPLGHGRWAAWARLEDKVTERRFIVASVHLLNGHNSTGQRASEMRTLMSRLAAVNPDRDPVVLGGDFNSGTHRRGDTVGPIVRSNGYRDTVEVAVETENAQVNTGSRKGNRAIMSHDHVDHIYVSDQFGVPVWKQWANLSGTTYVGKWLSDHNMIGATLTLAPDTEDLITKPTSVIKVPTGTAKTSASPTPSSGSEATSERSGQTEQPPTAEPTH